MPDILRVRFLGDHDCDIPLAGGLIQPDTVFTLPGKVVADSEADDHVLIETGNPPEQRALQRALFRIEKTAKPKE